MTDIVSCPVEGCDYEGVPNSVAAHYSGKKADTGHDGGYEKGRTLLETSGGSEAEPAEAEPVEQDQAQETAADGSGNPVHDGPDPDPDDSEATCPECGGDNWFDASEWTEYDRGCADCSDSDEWVVYDA